MKTILKTYHHVPYNIALPKPKKFFVYNNYMCRSDIRSSLFSLQFLICLSQVCMTIKFILDHCCYSHRIEVLSFNGSICSFFLIQYIHWQCGKWKRNKCNYVYVCPSVWYDWCSDARQGDCKTTNVLKKVFHFGKKMLFAICLMAGFAHGDCKESVVLKRKCKNICC